MQDFPSTTTRPIDLFSFLFSEATFQPFPALCWLSGVLRHSPHSCIHSLCDILPSCHLDTFCWTFFLSEPHTQGLFYYFILVETGSQFVAWAHSVDQASHGLCVWLSELSLPFPCFSLFYVSSQCTCFSFRKPSFLELSDPGDPVPSALYSYCLGISSFPLSLNVSHGFLFLG